MGSLASCRLTFPKSLFPFLWERRNSRAPLVSASPPALLLTFTPIGFMFPVPRGKACELIQSSSGVYPGPTHWDFPGFLLHREGGGKVGRQERAPGSAGSAVLPLSLPGFYCRRCIPREGGRVCVCGGAFPHSEQLLFNGGLHAGQAPQEVWRCPAPSEDEPGAAAMDRVVEIGAEAAAPGIGQGAGIHLRKDLRRIRCALLLCLLAVLLLMLPTAYLLVGNLRAPSSCGSQVRHGRTRVLSQTEPLWSSFNPRYGSVVLQRLAVTFLLAYAED